MLLRSPLIRLLLALSLTNGLLLPLAQTQPVQAQTVPASVSQGYTLLNRGWVKDAIVAFQRALQANPRSLEAKLGLAIAYQRAGQDANAWMAYQQVLAQDPNNRTALKAVGLLGGYKPQWQATGIAALTRLLQLSPGDNEARAQRALLLGYQGRFAEAIADYDIVLKANPKPEVIQQAAQIYSYSGNYQQSLALFQRYQQVSKQPISDGALTAYAAALRETGNPAQAVQVLESRLRTGKLDARTAIEIRAALAVAYQANQQPEQALQVLRPLRDQPEAALPLARALSTIGRQTRNAEVYREAIGFYRQALQREQAPSVGLVTEVADVLSEERTTQAEALQLYQQLRQQRPDDRGLLVKQLVLQNQLGQITRRELSQQLLAAAQPLPTSPAERQAFAQALVKLDPPEPQLLTVYQELLQSGVDVPFLNFRIAQIYLQQGNLAAAKQALTAYSATAAGAQDIAPELLLAEIERREGNLEASAKRYEAILASATSAEVQSNALQGLIAVRRSQGRLEDVLQVYDQILSRNPQNLRAKLGQASLAYQLERMSEADAEAVLNQWLSQFPNEAPPELFSLAGALPANAKRQALYDRLLDLQPNNVAVLTRSLQLVAQRNPQEVRSRLNEIIQRDPDNINAYFVQGEVAQNLKQYDLASQAYEEILRRQPDNADALFALGGVRFEQKRYTEATAIYTRLLALRPNDPDLRRLLAELSLAQDLPLTALQQFRQIEQIQGTAPSTTARIQKLQLDILKRRGFQPSWERY